VPDFPYPPRWYDFAHECPFLEVRNTLPPLVRASETKGTNKPWIPVPFFDLKFLTELAAGGAGTSKSAA